jgi:zinc transporter 1/2/3
MPKLLFALAIFAAAWFGGRLPSLLRDRNVGSRLLGWCTAFAAGIFLGFGLLHLLGDSRDAWSELGRNPAFAPALAVLGFMAILFLEHVLLPPAAHSVVHAHSGEPLSPEASAPLSSGRVPWALLLALSIHSILAGLALGVERSAAGVWFIFVAIVAHKWSAAFALGASLVRYDVAASRSRLLLLLFAAATPAGILAGSIAGGLLTSPEGRLFDATFSALAAGTFVYIGATDILQDTAHEVGQRLAKWVVAAIGVALTAVLSLWV